MMTHFAFVLMFCVLVGLARAASPAAVSGAVIKVNHDTKSFTVKTKDGEVVIKYDGKTTFNAVKPAETSIVTDGCKVKVNGKFSEGETAITAVEIEKLPDAWKSSAINVKDSFCMGVLHKKDNAMTVTVGDKNITIKSTEKMRYSIRGNSEAGELKEGKTVWVNVASVDGSGKRLAQYVVSKPAPNATPAKPAKPSVPDSNRQPAATTNEKPAAGSVSGSVIEVSFQDLILKVAMNSDPNRVIAYNITLFTEIVVNNKPAKIEDVKKGMKITVVSSDGKDAARINAEGGLSPIAPEPKKRKK